MDYETKKEYIEWFAIQDWTYFFTGTFRERKRPDGTITGNYTVDSARRAGERFFTRMGVDKKRLQLLFIEQGELYGKVHLHGLLRYDPDARPTALTIFQRWFDLYGRAGVESPRSQSAVSAYCTKYCTKHMKDETYLLL